MTTFIQQYKAARRASTPLIVIRTADPAATINGIRSSYNGTCPALVQWDIVQGMRSINQDGDKSLHSAGIMSDDPKINPVEALAACARLSPKTVAFFHNFHRVVSEQGVSQAAWNLRDVFKNESQRCAVFLCPSIDLPTELQQDILVLDEPLPSAEELREIVLDTYKSANLDLPKKDVVEKATDALSGLAAFPAEQVCAMSISKDGIDVSALWERKRALIEQTPGLSVWRGGEMFDDIGGCENVKKFLTDILKGNEPPRAVVFIDEIEKAVAGNGTDLSGVSTEMVGSLLSWMEDKNATGCIFIGPPGAAKSMVAKATGNTAGVPTIQFDLGAMKGSLVGESNARIRQSLKITDAVSQGRTLFLATCNSIGALPPELRRRFTLGTFYFDLPTAEERSLIWQMYIKKYGIAKSNSAIPEDEGWTGAEIRNCVRNAWKMKRSLKEAAAYVVPVSKSASDQVQRLREQANGKFISSAYSGVYEMKRDVEQSSRARKLEVQ